MIEIIEENAEPKDLEPMAEIINLLRSTGRRKIDSLITHMIKIGFFVAPCSGAYHLAKEGGLAEHSLNVYRHMDSLAQTWLLEEEYERMKDSIIICSLLHDLGKCGEYDKPNYIPNILKSGEQSASKPYITNPELLYVDHEIRSVVIARQYIKLSEDEYWAILNHNGLYGNFKYQISGKETPLYMLLHFADMWASRVTEGGE